jgi:hypothetical protein
MMLRAFVSFGSGPGGDFGDATNRDDLWNAGPHHRSQALKHQ